MMTFCRMMLVVSAAAAFVVPSRRRFAVPEAAKNKREEERMTDFYKRSFSDSAAAQYQFERARDKAKYSTKRAQRLGIKEGEEYDLDLALSANSNDAVTKIIAGALIVSILIAVYFGVLRPILEPASFTTEAGVTYVKDRRTGVFVEK